VSHSTISSMYAKYISAPVATEPLTSKVDKTIIKSPEQPEPLAKNAVPKIKKKKKKTPRNEIDAIFDL